MSRIRPDYAQVITKIAAVISAPKAVQPLTPNEINKDTTSGYPNNDWISLPQTLKIGNQPQVFSLGGIGLSVLSPAPQR
ncbi:MAG: hypothetical protein KIH44_002575 [Octadecabacter sp.]|nr:hypothetical protein [Octadecabacter sp.]